MSRLVTFTAAAGVLAVATFVACADSDEPAGAPPSPGQEGGTLPTTDAGAADDADVADAAAPIDAGPPECSKGGFCHTVLPKNQTLRGVWSDGVGTTWAVSEAGAILRYDGKAWSIHSKVTGSLWAIWGSDPTDIWIGGSTGLFHGDGATAASLVFTPVATPGPATPITSIWGTGANDVWATGSLEDSQDSRLLHHTGLADAGAVPEWTLEEVTPEVTLMKRVFGSTASGVWVAGQWENPEMFFRREIFLFRRSPGATEWLYKQLPSDPSDPSGEGDFDRFYDAAVSMDGASIWVLGRTHGRIPAFASATSNDGGKTFVFTFGVTGNTRLEPAFNAIGATDANNAFITGDYGGLQYRQSAQWKPAVITVTKFPFTAPFYALGGRADELWFVGKDVALRRDPSKAQP